MFHIADEHLLLEFAHVGTTKDNIEINVYSGEGNIPHLHFYHKQTNRRGCIRLDVPQYFSHGNKCDKLKAREVKNFILWLNSNAKSFSAIGIDLTNYEYLGILWNDNNPEHIIDFTEFSQPDYSQLNNC